MTETIFYRLLAYEDKGEGLITLINKPIVNFLDIYLNNIDDFTSIPGTPYPYWASNDIISLFKNMNTLKFGKRTAKQGLATALDFRFVRSWWEVDSGKILDSQNVQSNTIDSFVDWCKMETIRKKWVLFAKGGSFSQYYSDVHLIVNWKNDAEEIRNRINYATEKPYSNIWQLGGTINDYFFRPGITWSVRARQFNPWPLPKGCIFSHRGYSMFFEDEDLLTCYSFLNGKPWDYLFRLSLGRFGYPEYLVGIANILPWPDEIKADVLIAKNCLDKAMKIHSFRENTLIFSGIDLTVNLENIEPIILPSQDLFDNTGYDAYGINDEDRAEIERFYTERFGEPDNNDDDKEEDDAEEAVSEDTLESRAQRRISYIIGLAFGRWDLRKALDHSLLPDLPGPWDPLPVCPPAMLVGEDGDPVEEKPEDYALELPMDGILVDDPEHPRDIVDNIRKAMEQIWPDDFEAVEENLIQHLGVKDMRKYFQKPGAGGFWHDHVKYYSRSGRKAPIYWLLQSHKKNYAIWLYYPRLTKDTYYRALEFYVEPKIRLEEGRLEELRQKIQSGSESGSKLKRLEVEMDKKAEFVSELYDFRDKLMKVADLNLEPDMDDGVVINIAPLHEIVPWKEAEKYWGELLKGKYEWATIGKQMGGRGL